MSAYYAVDAPITGTLNNQLYPPVVEDYVTFIRGKNIEVPIKLSNYNNISDIKYIQILLRDLKSNYSMLKKEIFLNEIMVVPVSAVRDNMTIIINTDCIEQLEVNTYLKLQIRFCDSNTPMLREPVREIDGTYYSPNVSWLSDNLNHFSEWSRVCLLKGISKPYIFLKYFDLIKNNSNSILGIETLDLIGYMYFKDEDAKNEKESLKYYNVIVLDNHNNILYKTENIYSNPYNPNEINSHLKYVFLNGKAYKLIINFYTSSDYSFSKEYSFISLYTNPLFLDGDISFDIDSEENAILITCKNLKSDSGVGNLILKRSSNKDNFVLWETIYIKKGIEDFTWTDYTVESGVLYKYGLQVCDNKNNMSNLIKTEIEQNNPNGNKILCMTYADDAFLTKRGMQFKIKYNPSIGSYRQNVAESKIDTIGSKYPFIKRNGYIGYRQFSVSGTITAFCDEKGIFVNKDSLYGEYRNFYKNFNIENQIYDYSDFIYEKEFRKVIYNFLYANDVKLFRSLTEGNILVKLMDISFEPNQVLGRRIYNFSATAYEVDENNIDNYEKYNIIDKREILEDNSSVIEDKMGQFIIEVKNGFSKNIIEELTNHVYKETDKYTESLSDENIKYLKITFTSNPSMIAVDEIPLVPYDEENRETYDGKVLPGYILGTHFINEKGIIEYKNIKQNSNNSEFEIPNLRYSSDEEHPLPVISAIIDFVCSIERIKRSNEINNLGYGIGFKQYHDNTEANDNIFKIIRKSINIKNDNYVISFVSLNYVHIEAPIGATFEIGTVDNIGDTREVVINETGELTLYDKETTINDLVYKGIKFVKPSWLSEESPYTDVALRDNYYCIDNSGISYISTEDIQNPKNNCVYNFGSYNKIYHNSKWYFFPENEIVDIPSYLLIDYIYGTVEGEY